VSNGIIPCAFHSTIEVTSEITHTPTRHSRATALQRSVINLSAVAKIRGNIYFVV
jgi:hypothetical protein